MNQLFFGVVKTMNQLFFGVVKTMNQLFFGGGKNNESIVLWGGKRIYVMGLLNFMLERNVLLIIILHGSPCIRYLSINKSVFPNMDIVIDIYCIVMVKLNTFFYITDLYFQYFIIRFGLLLFVSDLKMCFSFRFNLFLYSIFMKYVAPLEVDLYEPFNPHFRLIIGFKMFFYEHKCWRNF